MGEVGEMMMFSKPEDGDSMFLRSVGIYRRVDTTPKPRTSSSSSSFSRPWKPQISQVGE
jgi:hypothetical protein